MEESRRNTKKHAERGHIGRKERGDGQDVPEGARNPAEYRREEKVRDHIITERDKQHRKLTLRGQSIEVTLAYARGWNYTTP